MSKRFFASRFWGSRFFNGEFWAGDGSALVPQAQVGGPDYGITAENIVIAWDSNNPDSVEIKDYILAQWTWLADAVLLPIDFTGKITGIEGESITQADFTSTIAPAFTALDDEVRYPILCYGFPTRIHENASLGADPTYQSVQMQLARLGASGARYDAGIVSGAMGSWVGTFVDDARYIPSTWGDYPGTRLLPSHIAMPTVAATKAYIDKIRAAHPGGSQITVYGNQRYGGKYHFDDNRANGTAAPFIDYRPFPHAIYYREELLDENPDADVTYYEDDTDLVMQSATNVKGLQTWGSHSDDIPDPMSQGDWTDGSADALSISTLSSWWLFSSEVSWNGRRGSASMNAFLSTAFGGTNYANTPVGFPSSVEEQYVDGAPYKRLFKHWERGDTGIEAGWKNRTNIHFTYHGYPFASGGTFINRSSTFAMRAKPGYEMQVETMPGYQMSLSARPGYMMQVEAT